MNVIKKTVELPDGRTISIETGKLAKQADGAVMLTMGNTMLLATVCAAKDAVPGTDFMPLQVEYREKFAAAGRFPGGFTKREGKASDYEILTCRLVDRALRPLFPSNYHAEVYVNVILYSADGVDMPDALAGFAASAALAVSDIPFEGPISEVRVARVNGEYVVNPTFAQLEQADMDIMVGATEENIMMVEGEMKEVTEQDLLNALKVAHEAIRMCTYKRKLAARIALAAEEKRIRDEQELNNERLRFYTNVTHELRTPLTLILGLLEDLTGDGLLSEPYRRKVGLIYRNALQLLDLINRLLDFRKVETRNRRLKVTKGWLGKLVMEVGLRYKELNRNPKVDFRVEVPSEEGRMYFDSEVVTTILNNLLGNAMKYTAEGNIALRLQYGEEGGRPYAEIIVEDTGYGIAPHALPHIFERYYQAEGKHQASGSGLGLALVKSLADLHEGMLRVESELGRGSVFVFRLWADCTYPEALHMEGATEGTDKKTEDAVAEIDNRPLLLVVEDNDDIRDYVASSFDDEYHVVTAVNGKVGWEETQRLVPDIIISDIMMPEMDGVELCRKVKEDMRTSHIPVILLTAKDSIRDKEEGYESGADSYLTKPFSAKLLDSRVRNLLEMRKRLALQITGKTKELTHEAAQTGIHLNKLDEEFLRRFTEVVTEHINREKLDIPFMAAEMNMSVSTLYRKLKGLTGLSGNEFIRKIKLKHSLRLLTEQGLNVTEAAYASGFNDLGHFRRCFKEEYGVSPSKYAKQ